MRNPLTRDDLTFLFFLCVFADLIGPPIRDLARAVEDHTASYRESCVLPGTIPDKPKGSGWKLTWEQQRKPRR